MSIKIQEFSGGKVIEVTIDGKLTAADYDTFVPLTQSRIDKYEKISMIIVLGEFRGWEMGALWEDLKFDYQHFSDIDRLAVVGEGAWDKILSSLAEPFTAAEIKYFDHSQLQAARQWAGAADANVKSDASIKSDAS